MMRYKVMIYDTLIAGYLLDPVSYAVVTQQALSLASGQIIICNPQLDVMSVKSYFGALVVSLAHI